MEGRSAQSLLNRPHHPRKICAPSNLLTTDGQDEHGSEMDFNRANEFAHKQAGVSFGFAEEAFALSLSVFILSIRDLIEQERF